MTRFPFRSHRQIRHTASIANRRSRCPAAEIWAEATLSSHALERAFQDAQRKECWGSQRKGLMNQRRPHLLALLLLLPLRLRSGEGLAPDTALDAFFRDYLATAFLLQPSLAAELGDHRHDGRGDDLSPGGCSRIIAHLRATLAQLPLRVPLEGLSPAARTDADILAHDLASSLWWWEEERPYERDPRSYYRHVTDRVYRLLCQSTRPWEERRQDVLALMTGIPDLLAVARATLRHPPRVMTETAIRQNRGAIRFYSEELHQLAGHDDPALHLAAVPVISALTAHQRWLEETLLPAATGPFRLGRERFHRKLELVLDAGMGADQVLEQAQDRLACLHHDLALLARQQWALCCPGEPLPPDDPAGRRQLISRVLAAIGRDHGTAETLAQEARATVQGITAFITAHSLVELPDPTRCQIVEMPEFRRGNSVADLSCAPPLDPGAPSLYSISPPPSSWDAERRESFLAEYNRRALQLLTIHEAFPGHYVQLTRNNAQASPIRRVISSGAYQEGWAVYCEQMMLDEGYGGGDTALRLIQLKLHLRTVANAILDHRMHCDELSEEEARHFLVEDAFQTPGEAALKVVRAQQTSCQLSTYYVGYLAMSSLRRQVQRELGGSFHLGRFHAALLAVGAVPPRLLPPLVLAELGGKPEPATTPSR